MPTLYGFMSDVALINRTGVIERVNSPDTAVGYFDDAMANYFTSPAAIRDPRTTRLIVPGMDPAEKAVGLMTYNFDFDQVGAVDFDSVLSAELQALFNIAELAYLSQGQTVEDLEAILTGTDHASLYDIYTAESLEISAGVTTSTVALSGGTQDPGNSIRNSITFTVNFTTIGSVTFTIWVAKAAFLADYPTSTITKVVFPANPTDLLAPTALLNVVDAISATSEYTATALGAEIANNDHTGFVAVDTTYIYTALTGESGVSITFKVFYKGHVPTTSECRTAIVNAITALIAGGTGTLEQWQTILPNLYVTAQWLLVPLWANTFTGDGITITAGISTYTDYLTKLVELYSADLPNYTEAYLRDNMQLFKVPSSELILAAVPNYDNATKDLTATALGDFGFYQHDPETANNPMPADAANLQTQVAAAIAVIEEHASLPVGMVYDTFNGDSYLKFTVGAVEFLLLAAEA